MKLCIKCNKEKSEENFHKDKLRPDGLFPYCRDCRGVKKIRCRSEKMTHSKGYVLLYIPDHPLSQSNGYVYEHRFVFHEKFKDKSLTCEKCGTNWLWRTYIDHIDHIDKNKSNNKISNLRPLCNSCNTTRTKKVFYKHKNCHPIEFNGVINTPEWWSRQGNIKVSATCIRDRKSKGMSDYNCLFLEKRTHKK